AERQEQALCSFLQPLRVIEGNDRKVIDTEPAIAILVHTHFLNLSLYLVQKLIQVIRGQNLGPVVVAQLVDQTLQLRLLGVTHELWHLTYCITSSPSSTRTSCH